MSDVIRFISKSERERARLIREARAIYDSIFPSADPAIREDERMASGNHALGSVDRSHPTKGRLS
jgi:hypothetical protein